MDYSKRELESLETIEQAWDGDELKIEEQNLRVWLTHPENRQYNGDYTVESRSSIAFPWSQMPKFFEY
jgi:hypothetical protein